jgi:hypothetical protein
MRGKALRRHHSLRQKVVAKKRLCRNGIPASKRQVGISSNTKCQCSCFLCGNPRKHEGKETIQERSARLALKEQEEIIPHVIRGRLRR